MLCVDHRGETLRRSLHRLRGRSETDAIHNLEFTVASKQKKRGVGQSNTPHYASHRMCLIVGVQGLRSSKNRSILGVCEDFESKRNAEITY